MPLDVILSIAAVVVLFNFLQQMETWLHQHIFKVGWLVTKNLQTTTILYYTFFLPGVVLYEFTRYLVAGVIDVRAERALAFPEKQDIAELRLNFVRPHKKAPSWKIAIINNAPVMVGLVVIYIIAVNILDVPGGLALMRSGTLEAIGAGLGYVTSRPDFVLWAYMIFTISGATIPNDLVIKGWGQFILIGVVVAGVLGAAGLFANFAGAVVPPLLNGVNTLSGLFLVMLAINALFTAVLSLIENTIERLTGDSATFKAGKLIAMKREEILALREQERQKELKARQAAKQKPAAPTGPPSVYRLPLPLPGAPGTLPAIQIMQPEASPALPEHGVRIQPELIPGVATPASPAAAPEPEAPAKPAFVIRPPRSLSSDPPDDEAEDEDPEATDDEPTGPSRPAVGAPGGGFRINPPDRALTGAPRTGSLFVSDEDDDEDDDDFDDEDDNRL